MRVRDAIEALTKLDPDLYLCGYDGEEWLGLFNGVSGVFAADVWHDSLPAGSRYVTLGFGGIIPHVRGEGAFAEKVPPDPPPLIEFECQRCHRRKTAPATSGLYCNCESWLPNMKPVTKEEAYAAETDPANRPEPGAEA